MITSDKYIFWTLVFVAGVCLMLALGCGEDEQGDDSPSSDSNDPDDDDASGDDDDNDNDDSIEATVTVDDPPTGNILARKVVVETSTPCSLTGKVTVINEIGYGSSSPETSEVGTHHEFWFYGLLENTLFDYSFSTESNGKQVVAEGSFLTPSLPDEEPEYDDIDFEPGAGSDWFMVHYVNVEENYALLLIYDRKGRIRFYHPEAIATFPQVMSNGEMVSGLEGSLVSLRLDGSEYTLLDVQLSESVFRKTHHKFYLEDIEVSRAAVVFAKLGSGLECDLTTPTDSAVGDGIAELDQNGQEVWSFDPFDHQGEILPEDLDPDICSLQFWGNGLYDWTHGNAVIPMPDENAYLVSYLSLDRFVKVDRGTGQIDWQLGHDLDFSWIGSEPENEKWFLLQHDPHWLENGNLLLFDNNKGVIWSRALELDVDTVNMTAQRVWEYRVPHTAVQGNAQRHENGSTLIASGASQLVIEVAPGGTQGDEQFLIDFSAGHIRAEYYPSLWVETPSK